DARTSSSAAAARGSTTALTLNGFDFAFARANSTCMSLSRFSALLPPLLLLSDLSLLFRLAESLAEVVSGLGERFCCNSCFLLLVLSGDRLRVIKSRVVIDTAFTAELDESEPILGDENPSVGDTAAMRVRCAS